MASATTLNEAKKTPGCLYYAMPVQQFETLGGFSKFNEVYTVGLEAAREVLKQWKAEGKLPTGLVDDVQAKSQAVKRGTRLRLVMLGFGRFDSCGQGAILADSRDFLNVLTGGCLSDLSINRKECTWLFNISPTSIACRS